MPPSPSPSPSFPSSSSITISQISHLSTNLYPTTVARLISQKSKPRSSKSKPSSSSGAGGDTDKAVSTFLENDRPRYEELPRTLRKRGGDGKEGNGEEGREEVVVGLGMEDVERLVRWKITRGKFRPTLLPLLSSNSPSLIRTTISRAFASYDPSNPSSTYVNALNTLCTLRGIGPATATLILSVRDPENVPFFSDELFAWLEGGAGIRAGKGLKTTVKIKYSMAEYERVWKSVQAVRERLLADGDDGGCVSAEMVEKAAFVIGHWDLLTENERNQVKETREYVGEMAQKDLEVQAHESPKGRGDADFEGKNGNHATGVEADTQRKRKPDSSTEQKRAVRKSKRVKR